MPAQVAFERKICILCANDEKITDLYPQTFSPSDLSAHVFSARRVTEHFHYKMVRCENCSLVFSRDVLKESDLGDLYRESHVTFDEVIPILRKDYLRPLKPYLNAAAKPKVLEVGCSSGFFLEELYENGITDVHGVEPSLDAVQKTPAHIRKNILVDLFKSDTLAPESFDIVCSFQTLDHLPNPKVFVEDCYRTLKKGGLLYVVMHNVESLQAQLLKDKSPIIDIEHIYLFNYKTARQLMEKSGFEVKELGAFKNSYPISYWLHMAPLPSIFKKTLLSLSKILGFGAWAPALAAGNMYVIAQKRG